jgi:hypothetical protein
MNVAGFLTQIDKAGGLARPNLFQVQIYVGALIANAKEGAGGWITEYAGVDAAGAGLRLALMCTAGELPGFQYATDQQHLYGPKFSFPTLPQYSDLTLTFFVGQDMMEKLFFDAWMFMIMEPTTNNFNYIDEFSTMIDIMQLDDQDDAPYVTTLIDAYPISISAMRVDWANNNEVHKMDVTFTYKRLEPFYGNDTSAGVKGARGRNQQPFEGTVQFGGPNLPRNNQNGIANNGLNINNGQ